MGTSYFDYIPNCLAKAFESTNSQELQRKFGRFASLGKTVSVLAGVTTAALLAFSILRGGIFGLIGTLLFATLTALAYDTYLASKNASNVSKDTKYFDAATSTDEKSREDAFSGIAEKVVEGTFFWSTVWSNIETKVSQKQRELQKSIKG